jgi:drug/metabolite transporter (DMT)-like permease
MAMVARHRGLGLWLALASAAAFGTSGPFAKALLVEGWTSGAIVLLRISGATVVLAVPTVLALRGRWHLVRRNLAAVLTYGTVAVAGCQVAYFLAVQRLEVGVALLLEYLGVVLVVIFVWARTRRAPGRLTAAGVGLAVVGLVLVLDLSGQTRPDPVGVLWGLAAAAGLATFFVLAAEETSLPPVALAGLGMGAGALVLGMLGAVGVVPMTFSSADVVLLGQAVPWWLSIGELAVVAAAAAYLLGVTAARLLGSTVASFVGLTEVLFAVLFAWVLLGELPGLVQLAGGVLIVVGVVAVRVGELRREHRARATAAADGADFPVPAGIA